MTIALTYNPICHPRACTAPPFILNFQFSILNFTSSSFTPFTSFTPCTSCAPCSHFTPSFPLGFHIPHYRNLFNGQEADNEVYENGAMYAFEYRMHDTRIGRFWSVDPLNAKFPWNSTYAFAENRVVDGMELEGLEWNPKKPLTTTNEQIPVHVVNASDNTQVATTNNSWLQTNPCGEIKEPKSISQLELWLNSPAKNAFDFTFKGLASFGYSYVNSPYSLLFGKTISGSSLTSSQRMDAFVDFVPGLLLKSLSMSGQIIRTGDGLKGYNKYVKENKRINVLPKQEDLPPSVKWQTETGMMFQVNKQNVQTLNESNRLFKSSNFTTPFLKNDFEQSQSSQNQNQN